MGQVGPFAEVPDKRLEYVMSIKALHPLYATKVLVNQMIARKERSAIVVTNSGLGLRPIPGCVAYSAANACSNFMAQALSFLKLYEFLMKAQKYFTINSWFKLIIYIYSILKWKII